MSVQASDWFGAKPPGLSETSSSIAQEGYTDQVGVESVTTSVVDIEFDLHSQVVCSNQWFLSPCRSPYSDFLCKRKY